MNMYNPFYLISGALLVGGLVVAVSTDSKVSGWLGMEINVMGFLGVLSVRSFMSISVGLKYFIIQVLGSSLFLLGIFVLYCGEFNVSSVVCQLGGVLAEVGLFCKAGVFPFHGWVPSVVSAGDWVSSWLVMGVQKLAPIYMMSVWSSSFLLYIGIVGLSFAGAVGGLNQLSVRGVLAYSSLVHGGWMLVGLSHSNELFLLYFIGYLIQLSVLVGVCFVVEANKGGSMVVSSLGGVMSLSLAGLPPMAGFLFKLMVFLSVANLGVLVAPVAGSIVALLFYLRLMFSFMLGYDFKLEDGAWQSVALFVSFNGLCYVTFIVVLGLL
uniref:NADH-ubiquinone oxidoreductase chain 2 n=1 Tax=Modiolus nipponicus TaxID=182714 RepID=A0A516EZJ2_MODNI|nr:NADH dehydrogenase subunit 2 [Modiolus nipponicus]QDO71919.1 NADH dehydrogenase subunit 2 [Modiolus nipponicus]